MTIHASQITLPVLEQGDMPTSRNRRLVPCQLQTELKIGVEADSVSVSDLIRTSAGVLCAYILIPIEGTVNSSRRFGDALVDT